MTTSDVEFRKMAENSVRNTSNWYSRSKKMSPAQIEAEFKMEEREIREVAAGTRPAPGNNIDLWRAKRVRPEPFCKFEPRTTVVNISNRRPCDVYVGRAGKGQDGYFGNPFKLDESVSRASILMKYEHWFNDRLDNDPEFKRRIHELKGKALGCFCAPKLCHGDIIADYLNNEVM